MIEEKEIKEMNRKVAEIGDVTNFERDNSSAANYFTEHLYEQDAKYYKANRSRYA